MKYSRTAITQLKRQYRSVLLKCAMLNAMVLAGISVTMPMNMAYATETPSIPSRGDSSVYTLTEVSSTEAYNFKKDGKYYRIDFPGHTTTSVTISEAEPADVSGKTKGSINITLPNEPNPRVIWYQYDTSKQITTRIYDTLDTTDTDNKVFKDSAASGLDGGAIYNNKYLPNKAIKADFVGNHTSGNAKGGAIHNHGGNSEWHAIGSITGDFIGNYVSSTSNNSIALGGAIYNEGYAKIGAITGNFFGNNTSSVGNETMSQGGAIFNDYGRIDNITGDFFSNYTLATGDNSHIRGGAIYSRGSINNITGDFVANYASFDGVNSMALGGAIFNQGDIGNITGNFIGNYAKTYGGAIANFYGEEPITIASITGNFVNNRAGEHGGAIYNSDSNSTINSIEGNFEGNHADNNGGAILNGGVIGSIKGNFADNNAGHSGGAIYQSGGTLSIDNSNFTGNSAHQGGAIYNTGNLIVTDTNFGNNEATGLGGAIYSTGNVTVNAVNNEVTFANNTANSVANDIYMAGTAESPVTLTLNAKLPLEINSGINGTNYNIVINDSSSSLSTVSFNANVSATSIINGLQKTLFNNANLTVTKGTNDGFIYGSGTFILNDGGAETPLVFNNNKNFLQKSLVIESGDFQTNAGKIYAYDGIVNKDILTLGDGAFASSVSGAGTTKIVGDVNFANTTSAISQNVYITNTGKLTGDTVNLTEAPVINDGTLVFNNATDGEIGQNIAGSDTDSNGIIEIAATDGVTIGLNGKTIRNNDVKMTSGTFDVTSIADTEHNIDASSVGNSIIANGGILSVQDGYIGKITLGNVDTTAGNLNLSMDLDLVNQEADKLTQKAGTSISGGNKVNLKEIILKSDAGLLTPDNIMVADSTIAASNLNLGQTAISGTNIGNILLSLTNDAEGIYLHTEHSDLANGITSSIPTKAYSMGENEAIDDLTLGGTSLSITTNGYDIISTSGNKSTDGITIANSGQTLSLTGTLDLYGNPETQISGFDTVISNSVGGTVNLKNVEFSDNNTDVLNAGNLNLEGTNSIDTIADDNTDLIGSINIVSGSSTIGSITQKSVNILPSAELNIGANKLSATDEVDNQGTLNLSNGNLVSNITDSQTTKTGVTNITGGVTNTSGKTISQKSVTIANTASLTTDANKVTSVDGISNAGTLILTGGNLVSSVSGEGTTNIAGNVDTSGKTINQGTVNVGQNGSDTAVAAILNNTTNPAVITATGDINITSLGVLTSAANNLISGGTNGIANAGTLNLAGGNLASSVTGDGTTNIIEDVTNTLGKTISQKLINVNEGVSLTTAADKVIATDRIFNKGSLILTGGTLTSTVRGADGQTYIENGNVIANSTLYQIINIEAGKGGTLTASADNVRGRVYNDVENGLVLTGGTTYLSPGKILGSGSTKIDAGTDGTVFNLNSIEQNVNIASGTLQNYKYIEGIFVPGYIKGNITIGTEGTLKSALHSDFIYYNNLITNNGKIYIEDDYLRNIAGALGTTYLEQDVITRGRDCTIAGTLDAQNHTVNMVDYAYNTLSVGDIKNAKLGINIDAADNLFDSIQVTGATSTGTVNLTDVDILNYNSVIGKNPYSITSQIINNANGSNVALDLTGLGDKTLTNSATYTYNVDVAKDMKWSDVIGEYTVTDATVNAAFGLDTTSVTNDSLTVTLTTTGGTETLTTQRDTLAALIAATGTGFENKTFTADSDATYVVGHNEAIDGLGTLAGNLIIDGGTEYAKIDGNSKSGITVNSGSTLTVKDADLDNFSGAAITNSGTLNIENIIFGSEDIGLAIVNEDIGLAIVNKEGGILKSNDSGYLLRVENAGTSLFVGDEFLSNRGGINGGAIYNTGSLILTETDFFFNKAEGLGGAIYSTKDVTINAENVALEFTGNVDSSGANDIYMAGTAQSPITLALNSKTTDHIILINDGINGTYYNTVINGAEDNEGEILVHGNINTNALTVSAGILVNNGDLTVKSGTNNGTIRGAGNFILNDSGAASPLVFNNNNRLTQRSLTITSGKFVTDTNNLYLISENDIDDDDFEIVDDIINDGTLTFNNTANNGIIVKNIKGSTTSSHGIVEIAVQDGVAISLNGKSITDNDVKLTSGIFDVTSNADDDGNINISSMGLISGNGILNVQDGETGNITLGTVATGTGDYTKNLNVAIDTNFATNTTETDSGITGHADVISVASLTGDGKIHISDIRMTADPIATEMTAQVATGDTAIENLDFTNTTISNMSDSVGSLLLSYDNDTNSATKGYLTAVHSDLTNAITSSITTKMYSMGGSEPAIDNLTLGGTSLSITTNGHDIVSTSSSADGIKIANSGQTLSITGTLDSSSGNPETTISGFKTAIDNSKGGTVNLTNIELNENTTDIQNEGTLNLNGRNTVNTIADNTTPTGTTNVKSGTSIIDRITQKVVEIFGGAKLETETVTASEQVKNAGDLTITGASNSSKITGNGTTEFTNNVNNSGDISQGTVKVADGKTLTTTGDITTDNLTNGGTVTLNSADTTLTIKGGTSDTPTTVGGTINGTGSTKIEGNAQNNGTIASAVEIAASGKLSTNANNVTGVITNNATGGLTLTSGDIQNSISGDGSTIISGTVTNTTNSSIGNAITVAATGSLTTAADKLGGAVTNGGTVQLNGGTLGQTITGGNISIIDDVDTNASNLAGATTVASSKELTLTGGDINNNIAGAGSTKVTGTVNNKANISTVTEVNGGALDNTNGNLANVTVTSGSLKSNADNISGTVANNGTYEITGGTIANAISGTGTTNINGAVVNNNTIGNTVTIGSGASLSTAVAGLGGNVISNAGTVELIGTGTLNNSIAGNTTITGDITSNGSLANVTLSGKLTSDADKVTGTVANSGTYTVTGGTIAGDVTGSGSLVVDGTVQNNANIANNVTINSGKALTSDADKISGTVANSGTYTVTAGTITGDVTGSGSMVVDGTVQNNANIANNVTINSGKALTSDADKISGTVANSGTYTVTAGTIAGDVTGSGSTVVDGTVQNNANIANNVTINSGKSLTTAANTIADVVNNGDLNLSGGTLSSAISGTGMTNINGDVTMATGATLADTTIASGGSLDIGTNNVTLGNTTINGTVKMEITDMAKGSDSYTGGHLNVANLNLGSTSKLSMTIASGLITEKNAATGSLDLIAASGTQSGQFAEMLSNNRYKVTATGDGKFQIAYTASASDIVDEANGTPNNKATGEAWDNAGAMSGLAAAMQNRLNELSQHDAKGYVDALTNLAPTDSMVHVGVTQDFNNLIGEQIAARLNREGLNSGDMFERQGAWVQMLYNHSKQDDNSKNQGFTGKTAGVAFGLDGKVNDKLTIGVGYAYGQTDVDSFGRDTDVDGHTIYAYGKYQPSAWYIRGMVNYGFAKYEEKANVGGLMNKSKYDVQNYGARAFVGYDLPNGFTPEVGLRLTHVDRDNYTDSFGQHVKTDNVDVLTASLGVNYSTTVTTKDQKWSPKAHFALTYDLLSDDANATVNVANSVYDIKGEKLNRFGVEAGVGAEISVGNWDFSAEYDLGTRKDYLSHTGMLKAKYNF